MVLVTGATGILGRVIVLELLKRGKTVRATKRMNSDLEEVRKSFRFYSDNPNDFFKQIQWVDIDFQDSISVENALADVEEVYHCAAFVSFDPKDSNHVYTTNIEGTAQLLYACENSAVRKFCHISSIAVLDRKNELGLLDEGSEYNPKISHSAYAASKQFAEMEVWRASAEGLNTVILNPGMIIGSGNWQQSSGALFPNFEKNRFTFSGGSSYVDVRDVAKIAVDLMEKNIFGERFILISETRKYADIANKVRKTLGLKPVKILSDSLLKAAKIANLAIGWAVPPLRMATKTNVEAVTNLTPISNEKIIKKIGYQFIPVDESIDFHLKNYIADK